MKEKLEVFSLVLGVIGLIGTIAATALPMWKVSAYIGANLIVMETLWEGLWMDCYYQVTRMQCKVYDSVLILPAELQASRALMSVSVGLAVVAVIVTVCGASRGQCWGDDVKKAKDAVSVCGACLFLLSSLATLIPVSWVGHSIISDFYNPQLEDGEKRELGGALFVGWATSGVLLLTGILIVVGYCQRKSQEEEPYADMHPVSVRDEGSGVAINRAPCSFHKRQEYV